MTEIIKSVGVIGAGQMGVGIAHVCAASGLGINLVDVSDDILSKAEATIGQNLARLVKRGKLTEEQKTLALNNLNVSSDVNAVSNCDLVTIGASSQP